MTDSDHLYDFVLRGLLTEEALDRAGRISRFPIDGDDQNLVEALSTENLAEDHVSSAHRMAHVYTVIAAFENSVRELISKTLLDEVGEDWWTKCVSSTVRKAAKNRMEEEEKTKWHTQRGDDPINYTMLPNLLNIIRANHQPYFEPFIPDLDWAASVFDTIERSRNVIMHSGVLGPRDVSRLGIYIRDWTAQVSM